MSNNNRAQRDDLEHQLRRLRASSSQHDDMPVKRSNAATMLSGWCMANGIPTNNQSSGSPHIPSQYDRVPGTNFDYLGNIIPNDYMRF